MAVWCVRPIDAIGSKVVYALEDRGIEFERVVLPPVILGLRAHIPLRRSQAVNQQEPAKALYTPMRAIPILGGERAF